MKPYNKLNQDFMPLSMRQCLNKQSMFMAMIKNKKDENLNQKVESLMKSERSVSETACIYVVIGITGLGYYRFKFLRPHNAGLAICLLFAYGLGRFYGTVHSMGTVVKEIGEIPYPDIEKVRLELVRRCKV